MKVKKLLLRYLFLILAIAAFIGIQEVGQKDRSLQLRWIRIALDINKRQLNAIANHLRDYEQITGHYPSNNQGLLSVPSLVKVCRSRQGEWKTEMPDKPLWICRIDKSGILSVWGEPFTYENRRNFHSDEFTDSGASVDRHRAYSIEVDKGIYVWSIAAKKDYEKYSMWTPRLEKIRKRLRWAGAGFVALYFVVLTAAAVDENPYKSRLHRIVYTVFIDGILLLFLGMIIFPIYARTCYEMSWNRRRTPELTKDYIELVNKYRDNGVISKAAYEKITVGLKEGE